MKPSTDVIVIGGGLIGLSLGLALRRQGATVLIVEREADAHFETRGLSGLFDLDEIWIGRNEFLVSMEEYAILLSYLLETMSEAQDLNLPYSYMEDFEYKGQRYSLIRQDGHRVLKKKDQL